MKIAIISDYDSRIKWGLSICYSLKQYLPMGHVEVDLYYKSCNTRYLEYYKVFLSNKFKYTNLHNVMLGLNFYDFVIISLGGTENLLVLTGFVGECRPLTITGFNGLTDGYDAHGLLCRFGADIICINSIKDMTSYSNTLHDLKLGGNSLTLTGLQRSYLNFKPDRTTEEAWRQPMLFIEQVGIPGTIKRARYLIEKIIHIARCNPHRDVLIKFRDEQGYQSVNHGKSHNDLRRIWNGYKRRMPDNIFFVDLAIESLIHVSDLCFSFTSSVLIEALALKKKVAVIADFGIDKKIGNHVFIGSDLFVTLDELANGVEPIVNNSWYENNCTVNYNNEFNLKLNTILSGGRKAIEPYYIKERLPFYYANLNKPKIKPKLFQYFYNTMLKGMRSE